MRKATLAAMLVTVSVVSVFADQPKRESDIGLNATYYKPGKDDRYGNGYGADAQMRFWHNQSVGLALSIGAASWQVDEQEEIVSDGFTAVGMSIDGDVTLIPLGGSLLFKPVNDDKISLSLEAGLRYVIVDSGVDAEVAAANATGALVAMKDTVEIDDGVVGVLGANIEGRVSKTTSLFAGIGYQFDIVKGDATFAGEDIGENELKALIVRAGFVITL